MNAMISGSAEGSSEPQVMINRSNKGVSLMTVSVQMAEKVPEISRDSLDELTEKDIPE